MLILQLRMKKMKEYTNMNSILQIIYKINLLKKKMKRISTKKKICLKIIKITPIMTMDR